MTQELFGLQPPPPPARWGIMEELRWNEYAEPRYESFISFVRNELGPHMGMPFLEEDYYRDAWNETWSHRFLVEEWPRGHSKTEFFGVWLTIWLAVFQPENPFSGLRIKEQELIAGEDGARTVLGNRIKHFFYMNPKLQRYKPEGAKMNKQVTGWNSEELYLTNGSMIHLRTIGGNIRGTHNDRVYADDLITEKQLLTDDKVWEIWKGAVDGITNAKRAMLQLTGTPMRITDVLYRCKETPGYHFVARPAIIDWDKKIILAKKRWTWDTLMEARARIGSLTFSQEYMLNPIDDSTALIKRAHIISCRDDTHTMVKHRSHFDAVYLGWDFAFSDKTTADHAAGVIIGKYAGKFYLLSYIRHQGMSALEQLDLIRELHAVYKFDMIGLEENSIMSITKEVRQLGLPIKLFRTGTVDEKNKKKPDFTATISLDKKAMVVRLGTTFENHAIVLPYKTEKDKEMMDILLNECISWVLDKGKLTEIGLHPDGPIALGMAFEVATKTSWVVG